MRTAVPGPTVLPFATRSQRRFVAADALPVLASIHVDHVDETATVPASVVECSDGAAPIAGIYRAIVDTTAVPLGSRVDVTLRATLAGRTVEESFDWVVGEGEFTDAQPPVAVVDPLAALSDDFSDSAIDPSWTVVLDTALIEENADGLVFFPADNSGTGRSWGGDERGPIVHKSVTGDFRMTADIVVTNDAGDGLPPLGGVEFHMGGLIVLDPRLDQVDAIDLGIGMWNGSYSFQTKNTAADATTLYANNALSGGGTTGVDTPAYEIVPGPGATDLQARLRITRVGQVFTVDVSYDGGGSIAHSRVWDRSAAPMAAELHVGLMAYSAFTVPTDFQTRCSGITFESL